MKKLILNADDFGYTRGINEAIARAHREGVLTSTTLMANGAAFEDAVERAKRLPELGVGCHFVLVGGNSVANPEEIPSLASREGKLPESLPALVARVTSGKIRGEDIEREFRAQIAKIRRAGIEPTHFDSHKHTHAHPRVFAAIAAAAREAGIRRVRNPFERLRDSRMLLKGVPLFSKQFLATMAARISARPFRRILEREGLSAPDRFLGLAITGGIGPEVLRRMTAATGEGVTEIMLHPGLYDEELRATGTRLNAQRETELGALLDPGVKELMEREGVRRVTFRELD